LQFLISNYKSGAGVHPAPPCVCPAISPRSVWDRRKRQYVRESRFAFAVGYEKTERNEVYNA